MTTLCDRDLAALQAFTPEQGIRITPWEDRQLQPCSYDLRLGSHFLLPRTELKRPRSIRRADNRFPEYSEITTARLCLKPMEFVLGSTLERVQIGSGYRASVEGKSTLGRLGLMVHCTAGYIDPGFDGQITLELLNVAPYEIDLVAGEPVCQLAVQMLSGAPDRLYGSKGLGSHYAGTQNGAVAPKL